MDIAGSRMRVFTRNGSCRASETGEGLLRVFYRLPSLRYRGGAAESVSAKLQLINRGVNPHAGDGKACSDRGWEMDRGWNIGGLLHCDIPLRLPCLYLVPRSTSFHRSCPPPLLNKFVVFRSLSLPSPNLHFQSHHSLHQRTVTKYCDAEYFHAGAAEWQSIPT